MTKRHLGGGGIDPAARDRWVWALGVVFATALAVRLLYLLSIHDAFFFHHLQTEPQEYDEWARRILDGPRAPLPPFEQAPGYPYFVAAVYALWGRSVGAVALVQAMLDAVSCVVIAMIGRQWLGRRAGVVAGALAAVYGPFIFFSATLVPSTLLVCVALMAIAAGVHRRWGVAGCLWATALVVRSEIVLAFPFALFDAWDRGGRSALRRAALPLAVVFAAFIGLNAAGSGKLVLFTTSGGVNLWLGNNSHADAVSPFISDALEPVERDVRSHAADAVAADRMFQEYALTFVRRQPLQAARLLAKKFLWTWTDRELPNTCDIEWVTGHSWLFGRPFFPLSFGMILPLACAGALLIGGRWRRLPLLLGLLAVGVVTPLMFFTNGRFRLIMVPALLLLASVALDRVASLLPEWRENGRVLRRAALAAMIGLVAAWGNFYGVRTYRIPEISVNTGVLEREAGHLKQAVRSLRDGLAGNPRDAIGWIHLALALEQQGDPGAALQAYLDASVLLPRNTMLREMAGRFFARQRLDPAFLDAYVNAGDEPARRAAGEQAQHALAAAGR